MRYHLTIICYWLFFSNLLVAKAYGLDIDIGPAMVESGDDRVQGGVIAHSFWKDRTFVASFYQRNFSQVHESTWMFGALKSFQGFKGQFKSEIGAAVLAETTELSYDTYSDSETRWNLGAFFAVRWKMVESKSLYMSLNWESALFPAGLQGLLLLSTGRKQMISAVMGMEL